MGFRDVELGGVRGQGLGIKSLGSGRAKAQCLGALSEATEAKEDFQGFQYALRLRFRVAK